VACQRAVLDKGEAAEQLQLQSWFGADHRMSSQSNQATNGGPDTKMIVRLAEITLTQSTLPAQMTEA
jgi:hypothetical protein